MTYKVSYIDTHNNQTLLTESFNNIEYYNLNNLIGKTDKFLSFSSYLNEVKVGETSRRKYYVVKLDVYHRDETKVLANVYVTRKTIYEGTKQYNDTLWLFLSNN